MDLAHVTMSPSRSLSTSPFFMTGWAWGVYGAWRVLRPCTTASRASIAAPPWEPPKH
jgi:hypothetical protein